VKENNTKMCLINTDITARSLRKNQMGKVLSKFNGCVGLQVMRNRKNQLKYR
jgi:hypothetical protein